MKPAFVRIALYSLLALALAGAIRFTPRPSDDTPRPADLLTTQAATPSWKLHFDTLSRGESLQSLLKRGGLSDADAGRAMQAASAGSLNERRIPAGMPVTIRTRVADSIPSEVSLELSLDRVLHLRRSGESWTGSEERVPWTTDTIIVGGTIASNLYDAMDASARNDLPASAREQLAWSLADVVDGRQRDPRVALKSVGGAPVPPAERTAFEQSRDRILAYLDSPAPGVAKLALR